MWNQQKDEAVARIGCGDARRMWNQQKDEAAARVGFRERNRFASLRRRCRMRAASACGTLHDP
jgi:hypothetical protein